MGHLSQHAVKLAKFLRLLWYLLGVGGRSIGMGWWVLCGTLGCADISAGITLDVGREHDTLGREPVPTSWEIGFTSVSGTRELVFRGGWPGEAQRLDLAKEAFGSFDARFLRDDAELAFGRSPAFAVSQLQGGTMSVFVQRRGEFARPTPDLDPREQPLLAVSGGRLLVVGGGDTLIAHDLAFGVTLDSRPSQVVPSAIGATEQAIYLTHERGLSRLVLDSEVFEDLAVPSDLSELRGARLLPAGRGLLWIGACNEHDTPSSTVVRIAADGTLQSQSIPNPLASRACASASDGTAWIATESQLTRVGAEGTASSFTHTALGAPVAAALPSDGSVVLVLRSEGTEPRLSTARIDPSCFSGGSCEPGAQHSLACAAGARVQALGVGPEVLLLCDSRVFRLRDGALDELSTREPRSQPSLVAISPDELALVGGAASFERYRPR